MGKRLRRSVASLALVAIPTLAGDALAGTAPFHPLPAFRELHTAQRAATAGDLMSPTVFGQLEYAQAAGVRPDRTRLVATFPGHARLYAAASGAGKLCYVYVERNGSLVGCGPRLMPGMPIMFLTEHGSGHPTLVAGLARDDVGSLSFRIGDAARTIPVRGNAFWYSDPTGGQPPRSFVIHFRDGHSATYPD